MPETVFRVHPAIGMARVGNSEEFYLGPESVAGEPLADGTVGGLPIRAGTESELISSADLRDRSGALKRQAARFRIFAYDDTGADTYPNGGGVEIQIGSTVGGRTVTDIVWTVHLANKKANSYVLNDDLGMNVYAPAHRAELQLRNAFDGDDLDNASRIRRLSIDPGPRAVRGANAAPVRFDKATFASYGDGRGGIRETATYPKSFPDDSFHQLYTPTGPIETIGELRTDEHGRLLVLGGYGRACGRIQDDGTPYPLIGDAIGPGVYGDVNADGWFDDTGDGPVTATVVFDDGTAAEVHAAWVVATDPSYAPQIANAVRLWDDVYDTWVRKLELAPEVFSHRYDPAHHPAFEADLAPIFRAAGLQRWTTNLPDRAVSAHDAVAQISATDRPGDTILTGLAFIRDPNNAAQQSVGAPFMPLSMGDSGVEFLSVTKTQYFFLEQWNRGLFDPGTGKPLGAGEFLDMAVLANCIGGRFAPGIEMTFIVRDPEIYVQDWEASGGGPFRINARSFDYDHAQVGQPMLTVGYIPQHPGPDGVSPAPLEPGDASKFMAVPWQTDYNSCATHNTAPNPTNSTTLYWSWPAQRPVQVYRAEDVRGTALGAQRYSVRGTGTWSDDLTNIGRYQALIDSVLNWHRIGFVVQGSVIDVDGAGGPFAADQFLEVQSRLDEPEIEPWPMNSGETENYSGSQFSVGSPGRTDRVDLD